jgi:hypothetical protein
MEWLEWLVNEAIWLPFRIAGGVMADIAVALLIGGAITLYERLRR